MRYKTSNTKEAKYVRRHNVYRCICGRKKIMPFRTKVFEMIWCPRCKKKTLHETP